MNEISAVWGYDFVHDFAGGGAFDLSLRWLHYKTPKPADGQRTAKPRAVIS
ncbi:MAG: hypothetical protein AAGH40_10785 [Verrucomicrobiota bacterium]